MRYSHFWHVFWWFGIGAGATSGLSVKAHSACGAVHPRRQHGYSGARHRPGTDQGLGPKRHRGQRARRGRRHRRRQGGQVASRRLHLADGPYRHAGGQPQPVPEAALQPGEGFRAGGLGGAGAQCAGGQPCRAGQNREGTGRAGQGQAGPAELWLGRQRQRGQPGDRILQAANRRLAAAHSLPGHRARRHRPDGRADPVAVHWRAGRHRPAQERPVARPGGVQPAASGRPARCTDRGGKRLPGF